MKCKENKPLKCLEIVRVVAKDEGMQFKKVNNN